MNAIIMAAGLSSRFAPLSYEKPKGLFMVKGEVLIERQIRQLKEAGIDDITVVVGYMKEKFFYLEDKFGVKIVVNGDYFRFNNTSSLMCVLDRLGDTYICCSDNYFTENVFLDKSGDAYYSLVYSPGKTDEWCVTLDGDDVITDVRVGGEASWYMAGHVFFSKEFSARFREILEREYAREETRVNLWEHLYARHLDTLVMKGRKYEASAIREFDSLDDLRKFDDNYVKNANSTILENICSVLHCNVRDIRDINAIKQGLTNNSFCFSVVKDGKTSKYVYRHPGVGTDEYISRESELFSMGVAKRLGLDRTFVYMSPQGWKISRYVDGARTLDYRNPEDVRTALSMIRRLHDASVKSGFDFHIWQKTLDFIEKIKDRGRADFEDFQELYDMMERLYRHTLEDGVQECLCHCDFYDPNILIGEDGSMNLIDWEYSGNDDPASDLGTFLCCSDYTFEEASEVLGIYLGDTPSPERKRHCFAYVAIASYYWFVWAIYQTATGNDVGEYLYLWHRMAKSYGKYSLELYE